MSFFHLTRRGAFGAGIAVLLAGCGSVRLVRADSEENEGAEGAERDGGFHAPLDEVGRPTRFRIVPDDYHVPYAGTAEDGRLFFLSEELFDTGTAERPASSYVGLFLWKSDGTFDEIKIDPVTGPSGTSDLVRQRLAELGVYDRGPIEVAPFTRMVDGVQFGWDVAEFEGVISIEITPGNFIAYGEPFDGLEYST